MSDDFADCLVTNTRMAARAITRRYDRKLRSYGLTATQLSLMGSMQRHGPSTVSELAEAHGFDRTTLTRNLDRLENSGLVQSQPAERGNGRIVALTERGRALLGELIPLWREAQAEMRDVLTPDGFGQTIETLKRLARA